MVCNKCNERRGEIKELKEIIKDLKKELKIQNKEMEARTSLQSCGFCEKEMYPHHWVTCLSRPKGDWKSLLLISEDDEDELI